MTECAAVTQWIGALVFFATGFVGVRLGRWTLAAMGLFMGTFFLRIGFINWGRNHGTTDIVGWASQPVVIFVHSLAIVILGIGILGELVLREWGRRE